MGTLWECFGHVLAMFWPLRWACFGHVLGMFRACVGHVSGMFWACSGHVSRMFWGCFGNVLAMFSHVSDVINFQNPTFSKNLKISSGVEIRSCSR